MPVPGLAFDLDSAYWVMALAGTALFIVKMVLLIFGGDGGDTSADAISDAGTGDAAHHSSGTFALFSIQSVLAFFMGAGWMGLAALKEWQVGNAYALVLSVAFGLFLMVLNAFLMSMLGKLGHEVHVELNTTLGHVGKVYLAIPEAGKGMGEVELSASGRKMIVKAKSTGPAIESFALVTVVEVLDEQIVVVTRRD
jgi:hypothetical protein